MPLLNSIPEKYANGFKELAQLSEAAFKKLKGGLSKAPLSSSIGQLANSISATDGFDVYEIGEIFESVGGLVASIEKKEMILEVIQDVVFICQVEDLIKPNEKNKFEKRLTLLVNSEQIYYASKADKLVSDYGNVFIQSRLISDIRPIFDMEIENGLQAAVIVHNLSIHYQSSEEPFHKDITLALTLQDVKSLKEILNRAEKKDSILKSVLEKKSIKNLDENKS